jgi:hypothetical protein
MEDSKLVEKILEKVWPEHPEDLTPEIIIKNFEKFSDSVGEVIASPKETTLRELPKENIYMAYIQTLKNLYNI